MHELLNVKTNKTISFASDVDELTPEQYLFYLDLVLQHLTGQITDPQEIKRKLFAMLTNLKWSWRMQFYRQHLEEEIWIALTEKINLLDSFFDIDNTDTENTIYTMHVKCGINLLPTYKHLHGPADMLSNITWGDFVNCLNAMKLINLARVEEDLAEIQNNTLDIFYLLYKQKESRAKNKEPRLKKEIPDTVLYHALTYFSYIYELITTVPIPINGEEVDFSIIWKGGEDNPNTDDKSGWAGILFSVAETGIFGKTTDVNNTNLYDVLMYLYKTKLQAIEDEKNANKIKADGEPK